MTTLRKLGEEVGHAILDGVGRIAGQVQERKPLPVDVLESDDAYLVVFDAPGARASDVRVNYEGNTVEVKIDRFRPHHDGFEMRFPGRGLALDGKATLPPDATVDPRSANATLTKTGTLRIELPKSEDATPESVDIEAADHAEEEPTPDEPDDE
ncbi:Hsp20/alpha crystallin family protein [Natronomonas sp. EA1]|uniref:Hsp20/alpha crystallin family protein n=1 Tax=Natronomonas sp. EA1 TaxID=3421655 RepID=UPI003EBC6711